MTNTTHHTHLQLLRHALKHQGVDGFIISVGDEYQNEYPPAHARRLEWLTGFTGSAGMAVVLRNKAALFVDGRYTLQAKQQVSARDYEHYNSADMRPEAWVEKNLPAKSVLAYDPWLHTLQEVRKYERVLAKANIALQPLAANPVDALWKGRPKPSLAPAIVHDMKYSGEASSAKRARIAKHLKEKKLDAALLTMPDAICWLLNLRGGDVEMTPLLLGFSILHADGSVVLYVEEKKISAAVKKFLGPKVKILPPDRLQQTLKELGKKKARVLYDPAHSTAWFYHQLKQAGAETVEGQDPILLPKGQKNAVELEGMRRAHVRDGAAVCRLLCWLEQTLKKRDVAELDVVKKLENFRAMNAMFRGLSFSTIAGAGPHGAIVHYRADKKSNRIIDRDNFLLLDSGGQYPDGTTDITRTVPVGKIYSEQKQNFTRVLKGHIALARAVFPHGTAGAQLDVLARAPLWQVGLDYDHGTGHGVGSYLGVHEGPQRIGKRGGDVALLPGMIISNEPGYYKAGEYGIRIENLVAVVPAAQKGFYGFETITQVPIDTRAVDVSLLTADEKKWLNAYHARVQKTLTPLLNGAEKIWLKERCKPI